MTTALVAGSFTPSVLLAVARRLGLLAEANLTVEERPVQSSPDQFRALLAGDLDVAFTSPDNALAYRFDPSNPLGTLADVRVVATLDRGLGLGLYARPGLDDPTAPDLVYAVDVPTSGFALAMYALVEQLGQDPTALRLESLGSTPRRAAALQRGECDLTMLNAGNELPALEAGCRLVARAVDVARPYVGTVLCVHGPHHVSAAQRLGDALQEAGRRIVAGGAADEAREEAARSLGLSDDLAERYVTRLSDPDEGLVLEPLDTAGLATVAQLRRTYLPRLVDGRDVLEDALAPAGGLVVPR